MLAFLLLLIEANQPHLIILSIQYRLLLSIIYFRYSMAKVHEVLRSHNLLELLTYQFQYVASWNNFVQWFKSAPVLISVVPKSFFISLFCQLFLKLFYVVSNIFLLEVECRGNFDSIVSIFKAVS